MSRDHELQCSEKGKVEVDKAGFGTYHTVARAAYGGTSRGKKFDYVLCIHFRNARGNLYCQGELR